MGRLKSEQVQLFYQFNLEDAVPDDHLVRRIDAALDLSCLRSQLAPHYSSMGRPSIDPELMIRMLVVGYVFAIRSERLICREVQVNLAYRWFCKLGIEDAIPDHSAFSRARNAVVPSAPPPLNIGTIKDLLLEYHQKYYDMDVTAVLDVAQKFVEEYAAQAKRPALVLDIDETSLTNWPNLIADDFGFVIGGSCDVLPSGPCGFNSWIVKSSAKPLEPALKLFNAAKAKGVAVIFITGRPDAQRDATILNLDHAGFVGWTELRTRPDRDGLLTVQEFKTAERTKVEEGEGYTIVANVGDQFSDVRGDHAGLCTFKVPNPFYFIR